MNNEPKTSNCRQLHRIQRGQMLENKVRIMFITLLVFSVAWINVSAAATISPRTSQEIRQCAVDLADLIHKEHQTRLLGLSMGSLEEPGQTVQFKLPLIKEALYIFTVCGEKNLTDLGLRILSQTGIKITESQQLSQRPILLFRPTETNPFIIEVYAENGTGSFAFINTVK